VDSTKPTKLNLWALLTFCFSTAIRVELYSSFSPSSDCCAVLREFIEHRPQRKLHIVLTCLYHSEDSRHSDALRSLDGYSNVQRLDIFTEKEWCLLRDRNILFLSPEAFHITIQWDCYWRRELLNILGILPWNTQNALANGMLYCLYRTFSSLLLEPECSIQLRIVCHGNDVASYIISYTITSSVEY
jgi:hypothetical protein